MSGVTSQKALNSRKEIMSGARRCFAEYGYEGATVLRLEEATGKSRGAIFHHFGDKESLFFALAKEEVAKVAKVVSTSGLIDVLREMLRDPERYKWLFIRLGITKQIRTDPIFKDKWAAHQKVLDDAIMQRLSEKAAEGSLRTDVPISVLHTYLVTTMDGVISRLASGTSTEGLDEVLDLVELSVRRLP